MIPVLGMHRSGTSALAGALHKLGADLGPESSLLSPAADNPRGFFECAPVVDLDRAILTALGGTWSTPPPLPPGWIDDERLKDLLPQIGVMSDEIPDEMVVKDPRLSLVAPLWRRYGNLLTPILCLRHPMAVAGSLTARNDFTTDQGLFLWFRYNAAALLSCPEALVLEYESLLADPGPQLVRAADHIGLGVSDMTVAVAARSLYQEMAHHDPVDLPETPIGIICGQLYDLLVSGQTLKENRELLIWSRVVTELPWAGPSDREIARALGETDKAKVTIDRLTKSNERLNERLRRLERELRTALTIVDMASISSNLDLILSENGTTID